MRIDPNKPLEKLVGSNRGIVRQRLGRFHLSHSVLEAARYARRGEDNDRKAFRSWRSYPVALRRGFALCVIETWTEYQQTYNYVMKGR